MSRPWIYLCFFLSGFSGLLNEVVWSRLFVYTMGSSHLSIAVVVSVFMGGLGLGSLLGGPLADRVSSPLRLYGALVAGAGLLSGAVAPLLWLAEPLLGLAYRLNDGEPGHPLFTLTKAVVCAGTILVPTTLMGATLPALARHLTRNVKEVGANLGALYGVNTFGAVAGAAAAGFYLIGKVGLGWTCVLGAGIDVAVGAAVLVLAGRSAQAAVAAPPRRQPAPAGEAAGVLRQELRAPVIAAMIAFGVSGFVNMCLQLGWTRALIISIGNSTYAFSVIVGIFIFGLAAGGWIAGLFADRVKNPIAVFGWLLVATALAAGMTIPWLGLSPARFAWDLGDLTRHGGFTFLGFLRAGVGGVALVILPSTVLMGMALPLVGRARALAAPGLAGSGLAGGLGRAIGAAYASNTLGAILGTALTGFVLVPLLGRIWLLLYLAVGLGLLAGVAVLLLAPGGRRPLRFSVLAVVIAGTLAAAYPTRPHGALGSGQSPGQSPGEVRALWHPVVFSLGAYNNIRSASAHPSPEAYARAMIRWWEPLYYRDGEVASVAVLRERVSGHICLNISGKTDASAGEFSMDLQTQLLSGHLPLLAHPRPRRALNLGLGGGMSLGAMAIHPDLEAIDLLELSPEVEEAARIYFAGANHAALVNPKVRKIIGDGRNHLAHTAMTYDVISSEPSNFWIAGLGNLFTEEFYRLALGRLNPGGVVCQWMYGYSIRMKDYHTALRTFLRVFPHVSVWSNHYADTLLLGSKEPIRFDRGRIEGALADSTVRAELRSIGIEEPEDLFRYFQGDGASLRQWVGEGPTNRDLFPVLEYSSPLGFYDPDARILPRLAEAASGPPPPSAFEGFSAEGLETALARRKNGRTLTRFLLSLYAMERDRALEAYRALAAEGDFWSLERAAGELVKRGAAGEARERFVRQARGIHDTVELCIADGFRAGPLEGAPSQIVSFRRGVAMDAKERWEPRLALAVTELRAGLFPESGKSLEAAEARRAPDYKVAQVRGILAGMQGDLASAEALLRRAIELSPPEGEADRAEASWNLGFCLEKRGRPDEAVGAYREAVKRGGDRVRAGIAIARCLRSRGDLEGALTEARAALQAAQEANEESAEARAEIARARAANGELAEAIRWMETAAQVSPREFGSELEELRRRGP